MSELAQAYADFREELLLEAEVAGDLQADAFFNIFAEMASDSGETIDLEHSPARRDGKGAWQVDGHALDVERGTLFIAISEFRSEPELQVLNAVQLNAAFKRARTFIERAADAAFINELEETGKAFEAAYPIHSQPGAIRRIRIVLFTNARLAAKRAPQVADEIMGRPVTYSVLDFARYTEILSSRAAPQPIEIVFEDIGARPIPCLEASSDSGDYRSFLIALPGAILAQIYGLYGAQLLEQNVRTFLQAKTKVNRGIITTLREKPGMFFAYNNGLTATASDIGLTRDANGQLALASITDLQIVNGGQTTASILYAKDVSKADLAGVHVQMKLSVVKPELIEEIVPRISRYANTQNRISEADFFSSHPFHLTMQQISRRLIAPPRPGSLSGSKWFYERARGQYRDASAYMTPAQKRKHELEFPRGQLIQKTDLAKFEVTFEPRPDIVSRGAQKCFMHFAEQAATGWKASQASYADGWYRDACAKAQLFRWTDQHVGKADWYAADRGFKSQTVSYTLAWLVERARRAGKAGLNLPLIWNTQEVPEELARAIETLAPQIARAIRDTPSATRNVGEYCKQAACWERIAAEPFEVEELPDQLLLDRDRALEDKKDAKATGKIDLEIGFEQRLFQLAPKAAKIRAAAIERKLLSPASDTALKKLEKLQLTFSPSEKSALQKLFARLEEAGVAVDTL